MLEAANRVDAPSVINMMMEMQSQDATMRRSKPRRGWKYAKWSAGKEWRAQGESDDEDLDRSGDEGDEDDEDESDEHAAFGLAAAKQATAFPAAAGGG